MELQIEIGTLQFSLPDEELDGNILEEKILQFTRQMGLRLMGEVLERLDEALMRERPADLQNLGFRTKNVATSLGDLQLHRRFYRDKNGAHHFLLDQYLGWGKQLRASQGFMREALCQAAQRSYRQAGEELEKQSGASVSHETIRSWTKLAGEAMEEAISHQAEEIFLKGQCPDGPAQPPERLFVEVDGTYLSVREAGRVHKKELKLAITYTGKEPRYPDGAQNSYRLVNKHAFGGMYDGAGLYERLVALYEPRLGLSRVREIYWGADGASWCWSGCEDYPQVVRHLCRFHVHREARRCFARDDQTVSRLMSLLWAGDGVGVEQFFAEQLRASSGTARKAREHLGGYILGNWEGILGWSRVRAALGPKAGLGAIEGNVDKLGVRRFKDRGCCWSTSGAHFLAQVRLAWLNGELDGALSWLSLAGRKVVVSPPEERRRRGAARSEFWRRGLLPALRIAMQRPWQVVLKNLSKVVTLA